VVVDRELNIWRQVLFLVHLSLNQLVEAGYGLNMMLFIMAQGRLSPVVVILHEITTPGAIFLSIFVVSMGLFFEVFLLRIRQVLFRNTIFDLFCLILVSFFIKEGVKGLDSLLLV